MISERAELLKSLRAAPVVLRGLVNGVGDDRLRRRPGGGEWAAIEVVAHLADTDERALARTRRMLAEAEPQLPAYDPDALARERGYLQFDLKPEIERFARIRAEQVDLLSSLDDAAWQRAGHHDEHGRITVQQLAAHTAGEDLDHLAQIARLLLGA